MGKNKNRPSAFLTGYEVSCFRCNSQHVISPRHQLNMVDFKGCRKADLEQYLWLGHHLDEQVVMYMIETENKKALDIWLKYNRLWINPELKAAFIKKFGYEALLSKGVSLPAELTSPLLSENKLDLVSKYFYQLAFRREDIFELLKLHNVPLTVKLLGQSPAVSEDFCPLILSYDEDEVYHAFFKHCGRLKGVCEEIIKNRPARLFRIMFEASPHTPCTEDELKLLVARNDLEMLNIYIEYFHFDKEMAAYIAEHASDEFFAECVRQGAFSCDSTAAYERLFSPKNRDLLLEFITKYQLSSAKWEIRLLQSGDEELIETYRKSCCFLAETICYILKNKLGKKFNVTYNDIETLNWRAETCIFTSGDEKLIEDYLFAGKAYSDGLTEIGEAVLFCNASIEILDAYMENQVPNVLAQQALISRWNSALISLFLHKYHYDFDPKVTALFLEKADAELAMQYLQSMENSQYFLSEESPESTEVLCQRSEPEFYHFVLENVILSENAQVLFIRNAPVELVYKLIDDIELYPLAEVEIFRHKDKKLVKFYLEKRGILPENADKFLFLWGIKLFDMFDEDSPLPPSIAECLNL